jgi:hypothetical protein
MNKITLSSEDQKNLKKLNRKLKLIKDRVVGVADYIHPGFYLWGKGGTSKSFTVLEELKRAKADYILHNSRMTGRGLVDVLRGFPTSIHVIEDCESMMADKLSWGVLRSALWSQSKAKPMVREITWTAFKVNIRFRFTGGIILIGNKDLSQQPELEAVKTRIATLELVATFNEIAALMRSVALRGFEYGEDYVTPAECLTVAEYVIERMRSLDRPLDMRVYVNGVKDYLQHKVGHASHHWRDLVETRLHETTILRERRAERIAKEKAIALEISQMELTQAGKLAEWTRRTGKSARAYWRRLRELSS